MSMLGPLQLSGDLAGLVRCYLERQQDTHCDLYRYLMTLAPDTRITFSDWWAWLERVQQRYPQRPVGLELGQLMQPEFVGVLGYLLLACDTLADALQGFERYQRLLHDGDRASAQLQDGLLCLRWSSEYGPSSRLSDEVLVVGMLSFIRRMTGQQQLAPQRVHFTFAAPVTGAADHEQACGCPVRFSQPATAIYFRPQDLALPVSQQDAGLRQLLEQQAQALLAVLPQSGEFVQRLREALLVALQTGQPASAFVARRLHLSERTLFRRLAEQGLTFRHVLTQIRMQLAQQYLREGRLTHSEIALLLGYSEHSAFCRAFRSACGETPGRWLASRR